MLDTVSFSSSVKKEVLESIQIASTSNQHLNFKSSELVSTEYNEFQDFEERVMFQDEFVLYFILMTVAQFRASKITIKSKNLAFLEMVEALFKSVFNKTLLYEKKSCFSFLRTTDKETYNLVRERLKSGFSFDAVRGKLTEPLPKLERSAQRSAIRGFFLAVGSLAEPKKSYQLELSFKRPTLARACQTLLRNFDLNPTSFQREHYHLLYLKGGDGIASFLSIIGANANFLVFEALRVGKEVSNNTNRAMNCYTANESRMVDASIKQIEAIEYIDKVQGLSSLCPELQETARLRLQYPTYSLKDLSELTRPKLAKSGMNHRLKRLIKIAEGLQAENRGKIESTDENH